MDRPDRSPPRLLAGAGPYAEEPTALFWLEGPPCYFRKKVGGIFYRNHRDRDSIFSLCEKMRLGGFCLSATFSPCQVNGVPNSALSKGACAPLSSSLTICFYSFTCILSLTSDPCGIKCAWGDSNSRQTV